MSGAARAYISLGAIKRFRCGIAGNAEISIAADRIGEGRLRRAGAAGDGEGGVEQIARSRRGQGDLFADIIDSPEALVVSVNADALFAGEPVGADGVKVSVAFGVQDPPVTGAS